MNITARSLGLELVPNGSMSSYRTLEQQKLLYGRYLAGGNLAAVPGQSNHGWGLAVDVATFPMRQTRRSRSVLATVGRRNGPTHRRSGGTSSTQAGHYAGPDPGPYGPSLTPTREDTVALALGTMPDGRFEVFVEDKNGEIFHAWQAKEGGWAGAEAGKRTAAWVSLGTPGKK